VFKKILFWLSVLVLCEDLAAVDPVVALGYLHKAVGFVKLISLIATRRQLRVFVNRVLRGR
jgi:hypothetical protein